MILNIFLGLGILILAYVLHNMQKDKDFYKHQAELAFGRIYKTIGTGQSELQRRYLQERKGKK